MTDSPMHDMIAALERLADLPEDAAKRAAPIVERVAKATADAGTTPDGQAWAPKKGGGRALERASDAISVNATGTVVRVTLSGVNVLHNYGTHRLPQREIIPSRRDDLPESYARAIEDAATLAFKAAMGGS